MADAETLGWVGDGDDVDAFVELDRAFDLRLPRDLSHIEHVGDLWKLIEERHLAGGERDGGCHSAMAFYRLRRAVARPGEPAPALDYVIERPVGVRWSDYLHELERKTGLRLPRPVMTSLAWSALLVAVAALVCGLFGWLPPAPLWAVGIAGILVATLAPRTLPRRDRTLRVLAVRAAEASPAALIAQGGRARHADLWRSMTEILSLEGTARDEEVSPRTRFFAQRSPLSNWAQRALLAVRLSMLLFVFMLVAAALLSAFAS